MALLAVIIFMAIGGGVAVWYHQRGEKEVLPKMLCIQRELISGYCSRNELSCPEPLRVAQKMDNSLFCKIKEHDKVHTDKVPEKK